MEENRAAELSTGLFDKVRQKIRSNKEVRLAGGYNCIPWKNLPGLSSIVPGIQRGKYYICTASSKVGKTQLCDYLFMYEPYEFIKKYKPKNINLKIFLFSLEMSKERKIMSILSYKIFKDKGLIVAPDDLLSVFEHKVLDDKIEAIIDEYEDYFREFEETVTIIDNVKNPFGIYKTVRDYLETHGHWTYKTIEWLNDDGTVVNKEVPDVYIPDDPNLFLEVIIDNYNVMMPEKGQTTFDAIHKFSSEYALNLRDKYNAAVIAVQQQAAAAESQQFTFSGNTIIDKLKPTAESLGDCKLSGRDCNIMFGLFGPVRYKIDSYNGYNIARLGDHYRELTVIFNRDGSGNCSDNLLFHGAVNYFQELPAKPDDSFYKRVEDKFNLR